MACAPLLSMAQEVIEVVPADPQAVDATCADGQPIAGSVSVADSPDDGITYRIESANPEGSWKVTASADEGFVFGNVNPEIWSADTLNDPADLVAVGTFTTDPCAGQMTVESETPTEVATETEPPTEVVTETPAPVETETQVPVEAEAPVSATETPIPASPTQTEIPGTPLPTEVPGTPTVAVTETTYASPTATVAGSTPSAARPASIGLLAEMPAPEPFQIVKVDPDGNPIDGAVFVVRECNWQAAAGVYTCRFPGSMILNHDSNYVAEMITTLPSDDTIVTQYLTFREVSSPRGFVLSEDETTVYNICGAWRTGDTCDSPVVGDTLSLVNQPMEPTGITHRTAPMMQKLDDQGNLLNGAWIDAEWCAIASDGGETCTTFREATDNRVAFPNYDQQYLFTNFGFSPSSSPTASYHVRVWEASPPAGYALDPTPQDIWYICGAWRTTNDCDVAVLPNNMITFVDTPGTYATTTPVPGDGEVVHFRAPMMQKVSPDGTLIDGARVTVEFCIANDDCYDYGSVENPYILNFDYAALRNSIYMEPSYDTTWKYHISITELSAPAGYVRNTAPTEAWYICGAWRTADACDAPIYDGNVMQIVNQPGQDDPYSYEPTPNADGLYHTRAPYMFKTDQNGNLAARTYYSVESCTRFHNDPDWTCISLYDYSNNSRELNQSYNFFNNEFYLEFYYSETSTHHLRFFEVSAPAGYEMSTQEFNLWYICGAWRTANACDAPMLPNNEVVFVNNRTENPTPTPELTHRAFPTLLKIDDEGNPIDGAVVSGERCFRSLETEEYTCISLNAYGDGTITLNQDANFLNDYLAGNFVYHDYVSRSVTIYEVSAPSGYQLDTTPVTVWYACGAWRTTESCDGPLLVDNQIVLTNNPIVAPSPSPTTTPVTPSLTTTPVTPSPTTTPVTPSPTTTPVTPSPTTTTVTPSPTTTPATPSPTAAATQSAASETTPTPTAASVTALPSTGSGSADSGGTFIILSALAGACAVFGIRRKRAA